VPKGLSENTDIWLLLRTRKLDIQGALFKGGK
jgi:hypothetical protein